MTVQKTYTARELAELKLNGLPHTQRGIDALSKKKEWPSQPRQGRGGGREFPLETLPAELRDAIIAKGGVNNKDLFAPVEGLTEAVLPSKPDQRHIAKMEVVTKFNRYRNLHLELSVARLEPMFQVFYRQQAVITPDKLPYNVINDFSLPTLRRWRKQAEENAKALSGRYGGRKGTSVINRAAGGEMDKYIAALIIENSHYTAGHIRDLCRSRFGEELVVTVPRTGEEKRVPMPSLRAFERHMAAWKEENAQLYTKMTNPAAFKNKFRVSIGDASEFAQGLNHWWEIDASRADIMCTDGKRYNIYAIIDVWSRRALFSVSPTAATEASLLLVRRAIMEWGIPDNIKTDNGSDFISYRFKLAMSTLGINQEICPPFSPEKKPHVERVIKTIQHGLMPLLPGFLGHNVADRKRIEDTKDFSKRLGQSGKEVFEVAMSAEELQKAMDDWAKNKYSQEVHSTLGMAPLAKAATWTGQIRKPKDERALDLLLAPLAGKDGLRNVEKKGIRVDGARYMAPELCIHIDRDVIVRHDPADLGRVFVFNLDNEFICEALNHEMLGIDPVAASKAHRAAQNEALREAEQRIRETIRKKGNKLDQAKDYLDFHAKSAVIEMPRPAGEHSTPALEAATQAVNKTPSEPRSEEEIIRVANLAERMKAEAEAEKPMTDNERYAAKAKDIEERKAADKPVSTAEEDWLEHMKDKPWYIAWKNREKDLAALAEYAASQKETPGEGPDAS